MKNFNFIYKLPSDILSRIIPYAYNTQNRELLQDIVNYTKTKTQLSELYFNFWIIKIQDIEPEDKNWLINDIFSYANNNYPSMLGFVDNFYNILKRNKQLQTNQHVDMYVTNLEKKNSTTQINILLGLLHPNERNKFLHFVVNDMFNVDNH